MEVDELSDEEQIAFLGLAKLIVRADGILSADENDFLLKLAGDWGGKAFSSKIQQAGRIYSTTKDAMTAADAITRHEVQEFVFYHLVDLAASDDVVEEEAQILGTLAMKWGVELPSDTLSGN